MNPSKLMLLSLLFPALSFAGSFNMDDNGEDSAPRTHALKGLYGVAKTICAQALDGYEAGKISQQNVVDACTNVKGVAWDPNRDNRMSPITHRSTPADQKIGRSSAIVVGLKGRTAATQVCPGVYLTTAHALLDDPLEAQRQNREHKAFKGRSISVVSYPFSKANKMKVVGGHNIISPRYGKGREANWNNTATDFAFIKVGVANAKHPNDFVPLATGGGHVLQNAVSSNKIDLHMYRPKPRWRTKSDGMIDFNQKYINGVHDAMNYQKQPQKVNQKCNSWAVRGRHYNTTDCGMDVGMSGSGLISTINKTPYLLSIAFRADNIIVDTKGGKAPENFGLNTTMMCAYYQKACGKPCVNLKDLLSNR